MKAKEKVDRLTTIAAVLTIVMLFAVAAFAQGASFRFFGPLSRIITPNGDEAKPNGTAIFCFDNPAGSGVSGTVYSLLGGTVATMGPAASNPAQSACPLGAFDTAGNPGVSGGYLSWDGRSNGAVVRSGVYVYRIISEEKTYTGTLVVVK